MISLVWDIKQKATNEPTKQTNCQETKLIGMDNRMVVTKREGARWEEDEESGGGQTHGDGRKLDFVW